MEAAIQHCFCVTVLGAHHIGLDVIQPDRFVPGGHQEELGGVRAKLDGGNAIVSALVQLVLV